MQPDVSTLIVSETVTLDFLGDTGHEGLLDADLIYDGRDPFAMSLVFGTVPPITWTFSRDLLLAGLYEPTGDGDVQIWPGVTTDGVATVLFEFSSPDGCVVAQVELREVHAFATRMVAVVPVGLEADYVDLDAAVEALLGDSSPDLIV